MTRAGPILLALTVLFATQTFAQDSTPASARRPRASQSRPAATGTRDTLRETIDTTEADTVPRGFAVRASVEPDTVTVGDPFVSGVAVSVPAGTRVQAEIAKDSADRWRVLAAPQSTPRDSARTRWLVVARMVAWQPGTMDSVHARLRLTDADGRTTTIPVALRLPFVRAVLPGDSTQWRVKPPHDAWGPSRDWRVIALLAAAAALLLAVIAWLATKLLRRRRANAVPVSARQRALATLEKARTSGFAEAGNWKAFYTLVGDALRGFAAAMDRRWSTDLTSSELLAEMRSGGVTSARVDALERLLETGDLAKFARRGRTAEDALRDLDDARKWVEGFEIPLAEPAAAAEVAS